MLCFISVGIPLSVGFYCPIRQNKLWYISLNNAGDGAVKSHDLLDSWSLYMQMFAAGHFSSVPPSLHLAFSAGCRTSQDLGSCYIFYYIITRVPSSFSLVENRDLLENRRTADAILVTSQSQPFQPFVLCRSWSRQIACEIWQKFTTFLFIRQTDNLLSSVCSVIDTR